MTDTKRPSLAGRVTPKSEKNRNALLDQGLSLTVDGETYTVTAGDLTALDSQALRKQVGLSFSGLLNAMHDDPDIDLIAGVVWLSRRINGERGLDYADVAAAMGYDVLDSIEIKEPAVEDDPEA